MRFKEQGKVRIHACSTAGKIWGATVPADFSDLVDDIVGVVQYLTHAQEADLLQVF